MKKYAVLLFGLVVVFSCIDLPVIAIESGITAEKSEKIVNRCSTIKDNLRSLQREDAVARSHLYKYYDTVLTNFLTPLNVALVANNISNIDLVKNQNDFAEVRAKFVEEYSSYQRALESLVSIDCEATPAKFYEKLVSVRAERKKVSDDVLKLDGLVNKQTVLAKKLEKDL